MARLFASMGLAALALLGVAHPAAAQKVMKPGAWEMTASVTRQAAGKPAEAMGEHKLRMCLTAEWLAKEPYLSSQIDEKKAAARGGKCTTADVKRQGNAASWNMKCTLTSGASMQAKVANQAEAETLSMRMEQDVRTASGSQGQVVMKSTGRYIGACQPGMPKPS